MIIINIIFLSLNNLNKGFSKYNYLLEYWIKKYSIKSLRIYIIIFRKNNHFIIGNKTI